jgi:thioredoxin-like negative regulator of GroEL
VVRRFLRDRILTIGAVAIVLTIIGIMIWAGRTRPNTLPMDEARNALENGEAANAERALLQASKLDPGDPEPWVLLLEIMRVEDRQIEAQRIGWTAYQAVSSRSKRAILKAMTLALLADTPEDLARSTLARWIDADPSDIDARVALTQRIAASPRAQDPDRAARVASLSRIVEEHPNHIAAHEALALALADSGEPDRGREVLERWPPDGRDARYSRMKGRWDLEYDHKYARAIEEFQQSLKVLPHDWRTLYRLARAYRNAGMEEESKKASTDVEKLREGLDPLLLGRRLDKDLAALEDPKSRLDLADLCQRAGLVQLADAWRRDAQDRTAQHPNRHP